MPLGRVKYIPHLSFQYLVTLSFWPGRFRNIIDRTFILSLTRLPTLVSCSLVSRPSSLISCLLSLVSRLLSPSLGHKNTNAPLILKVLEIIFLSGAKTYNGAFIGVFQGGLNLFDPKIARKNIISWTFKISGILIVIFYATSLTNVAYCRYLDVWVFGGNASYACLHYLKIVE